MVVKSSMQVRAVNENYDDVIDFISQQTVNVESPAAQEIVVAAEELVFNVISYAYEDGKEGNIFVECVRHEDSTLFQLVIRDNGRPFNPLAWKHTARNPKGCGIMMAKKLMSQLRYTRDDGQNVLTATKYY